MQEQLIIENEAKLEEKLKELSGSLKALEVSCQEMITFHDGFSYFADGCGLTILAAIEGRRRGGSLRGRIERNLQSN